MIRDRTQRPGRFIRSCRIGFAFAICGSLLIGCQSRQQRSKKHFESGQRYFHQQKYEEAVIEFRRSQEEDPDAWESAHYAGLANLKIGRIQEGLRALNASIEINPKATVPRLDLAQLMIDGSQFEDARQQLLIVEEAEPANARVHELFGRSYLLEQKYRTALEEFQKVSALDPGNEQIWLAAGLAAIGAKDYRLAEQYLKQAIDLRPDMADAHRNYANLLELTGHPHDAEASLAQAASHFPRSLDLSFALAEFYFRRGNIQRLEELFAGLYQREGDFTDLRLQIADFWMLRDQVSRAVAEYEKIWSGHPALILQKKLISAYITLQNLSRAEELNADLLQRQPQDLDARTFHAAISYLKHDPGAAVVELQSVLKEDAHSAMAHYYLGLSLVATSQVEIARSEFLECIRLDPKFFHAYVQLAEMSLRDNDDQQAVYFSQQAIASAPGMLDGYLLLAQAQMLKPDLTAARVALKAIESYPALPPEFFLVQARWYGLNHDEKNASRQYEIALARSPDPIGVLGQMARAAVEHGQARAAIQRVKRWGAKAPPSAALSQLLAELYLEIHDLAAANASCDEAIRLGPDQADGYFLKGRVFQEQGLSAPALKMFDKAIEKDPGHTLAYLRASETSMRMGNGEAAKSYLDAALKQDPGSFAVKRDLVHWYAEKKANLDTALGMAQELKRKSPNDIAVRDSLAWIYFQKGLNDLALSEYKPISGSLSSNPQAQFHLGMVYLKAGKQRDGERAIRRALDLGLSPESFAADARDALAKSMATAPP